MRCEYRHKAFSHSDSHPNIFNPFNKATHTHDGTDQCWMVQVKNDVTEFLSPNGQDTKRYCLFHVHHAPEGWTERKWTETKWDETSIGEKQSTRLKELLDQWNAENEKLKSNKETLFTFAFPGIQCGDIDYINSFSHHLVFCGATFSGSIWFNNSRFDGWAEFSNVTFSGTTKFDGTAFSSLTFFHHATFNGNAEFEHATFNGYTMFHYAAFSGDVSFNFSTFNRKFKFHLTKMERGGRFVNCRFKTFTYQTHIGERLLFNHCKTDGELNFTDQDCSRLAFLNMDLTKADFLGADVSKTRFDACQWKERGGPKYAAVYKHDYYLKPAQQTTDEEKKKKNDEDYKDRVSKLKALYRQLMKNLEENREYKQAGDFHYREMELRQKMLKDRLADPESRVERLMLWLYRVVGDFGENYVKLGFCLIVSWLASASLIWAFNTDKTYLHILGIVVTAIIPGWPKPETVVQTVSKFSWLWKGVLIVEAVIALILTALFAMAVNRRYRR